MEVFPLISEVPGSELARVRGDTECMATETRAMRAAFPVALVNMPFASILRPSIQVGLLKSIAASHAFPVTALHLNLDFAQRIGTALYEGLCQHRGRLFGDWLFSIAAFGTEA